MLFCSHPPNILILSDHHLRCTNSNGHGIVLFCSCLDIWRRPVHGALLDTMTSLTAQLLAAKAAASAIMCSGLVLLVAGLRAIPELPVKRTLVQSLEYPEALDHAGSVVVTI